MLSVPILDSGLTSIGVSSLYLVAFLPALLYYVLIRPLFLAPLSHVPGPVLCKLSWYYLALYDMRLQRNDKIKEWHKRYGPILCIRPREISFSSPNLMREIYGTSGKYTKSDFFDNFMVYGERSLFSLALYWDHRHKRQLISSFYHQTSINKPVIQDGIRDRVRAFLDRIEDILTESKSVNIYPILNCYAFDNVTRLLYGERHCSHTIETDCDERRILLGLKQTQLWGPLKFNFPLIYNWRLSRYLLPATFVQSLTADDDLGKWNLRRLSAAITDKASETDYTLLQRMINIKDKDGKSLSRGYIASELYDNVLAAQETTAVALTYLVYYLSRQPAWQARIHNEVSKLPLQADGYPAARDIDTLPLLDAFIREVLRMSPGSGGRQERMVPTGGKDYDGVYIPEGVRVSASPLALHYNPDIFLEPETFDPERWVNRSPEQLRTLETSFIPFGYGARMCLGKALATSEMKQLTACFYMKYSTEVDTTLTTEEMMWQTGTTEAVPKGLRCDLLVTPIAHRPSSD